MPVSLADGCLVLAAATVGDALPNITIAGHEIPIGLASVFLVLFATSVANLFTKSVATVAGLIFAGTFFAIFTVSVTAGSTNLSTIVASLSATPAAAVNPARSGPRSRSR